MPKIAVSATTLLLSGVIYPDGPDGCWLRMLGVRPGSPGAGGGYSRLYRRGKTVYAHRLAYETWVGPIPAGLQIDHLCERRNCINPAHLRPATPTENQAHGKTNAAKAHCPKGHPYDVANTIITSQGRRLCRACYRSPRRRPTHCPKGHPYDPPNINQNNGWRCRECRRITNAAAYQRRRARLRR